MEKRSLQPRIQQAGAWLPSWCTALRAGGKQSWAIGKACQEAADLKRMKKKPRRLEHHFQREPEHHFQRETSSSFPPPVTPPPSILHLHPVPLASRKHPSPATHYFSMSAEGAEKLTDMGTRSRNHNETPPITQGLEHELNSLTFRRT